MAKRRQARSLIFSAAAPAVAVLVVAVFAGFALLGSNGLLSLGDYRQQLGNRQVELAQLAAHRARLENQKRLIQRGDPDYADELVRRATDLVKTDEYVVIQR